MDLNENLDNIEKRISEYYEIEFESDDLDTQYNTLLKNEIKELIVQAKNNSAKLIDRSLMVLAENTGCAEDQEIADKIIKFLHDNSYITDDQLNLFYDNTGTQRWEE